MSHAILYKRQTLNTEQSYSTALIIILMGQNNSQTLQLRLTSLKNWQPSHRDCSIYVNQVTSEKVKRHFVRISVRDLPRQMALYASRVNNNIPFICRILYFHPVNAESKAQQDYEKDTRQMYVYTDVLFPLADWHKDQIVCALTGLRKLMQAKGPFKITEHMFFQNQTGEIKVWASQNPISNHPDLRYANEEQALADFATIITKKNMNVANFILGCLNLREVYEKLTNPPRQTLSPHQNYSHRASESDDISKKKIQKQYTILSPTPYRNVFGETMETLKFKLEGPRTPKAMKNIEYPQSSIPAQDEKPCSTKIDQYKEYFYPNKANVKSDEMLFNRAKINFNNQNSLQFKKNREHKMQNNYVNFKTSQQSTDNKNICQSNINDNGKNIHEPAKPVAFQHRYETHANLGNTSSYISSNAGSAWKSNQTPNFMTTDCQKQTPKSNPNNTKYFKTPKQDKSKPFQFTIINNNVNNYVSNITHNHFVKIEKNQSELFQFKNTEPHKFNPNFNAQFSRQPQKTKERSFNIPVFIQQKKKSSDNEQIGQTNLVNKSKSNLMLSKKNSIALNPQEQTHQIVNQDKPFAELTEKQQQKTNIFLKNDNTNSYYRFTTNHNYNSPYPKTPTPSSNQPTFTSFTSFQKANNGNFELKVPLRTKTTEFYKGKEAHREGNLQNKSFTGNQLLKNNEVDHSQKQPLKQNITLTKYPSDPGQKETKQQQVPKPDKKPEPKVDFKRQIKNEFQFLMGGEPKQQEKHDEPKSIPVLKMQQTHGRQVKEGNLKDKIKKKQIVFAQLKKEALKVLTDD